MVEDTKLQNKLVSKIYNVRLKESIATFTKNLFYVMFDDEPATELQHLENLFIEMSSKLEIEDAFKIWETFKFNLPSIRRRLDLDAIAIEQHDPAAKSLEEVYLAYPGFYAIAIYRLSHALVELNVPIIPRMMSEYAHGITGTDIHPGAEIGDSFFIDHATGIVIGETSVIKDNVKIYQGVTLGGVQVKKSLSATKRHPTIENNVIIYANATILGGDVVIGANSIIGANVCVTVSVPEHSILTYQKEFKIRSRNND
ncbi:serine O-acetyltransferase EpsC [Formosa algae]|uniref:Serine O-acetyltransferase n=1 Tax=Formosa algae TaxID=225843 RepID=A0A9X0YJX2_9FLAO|nr:serine O-acetyltransferase EpsC [Formosa algae]MBP1838251.1 serine O-acetyltransferase [Formosa algae]MDQ0334386.1 serine O-acetyltransferase [Formosa algae]OEI80671.1 serine acetyltransferase [Formosa algae]PNW29944.1 serine acetyltransferase [Formosa algae]